MRSPRQREKKAQQHQCAAEGSPDAGQLRFAAVHFPALVPAKHRQTAIVNTVLDVDVPAEGALPAEG